MNAKARLISFTLLIGNREVSELPNGSINDNWQSSGVIGTEGFNLSISRRQSSFLGDYYA